MKITVELSTDGIKEARKQLKSYRNSLPRKCEAFVSKLADRGIQTATQHTGRYSGYIIFSKELNRTADGCRGIMLATETGLIHRTWQDPSAPNGIAEADVSPLLMAEFGSGKKAEINPRGGEFGMGRGTFPGQIHAFDEHGWSWKEVGQDEWRHSLGEVPTMPMQSAMAEMENAIFEVAREVFG